jgi:hypothetical protein
MENEEEKEPQSRIHRREASRNHDSAIHQHTQYGSIKGETTQKHIKVARRATLHNIKIFTWFPAESSGEGRKFYYINSKGKNYKKKLNSMPPHQQAPWWKKAQKVQQQQSHGKEASRSQSRKWMKSPRE